jgi:hypothetical protein
VHIQRRVKGERVGLGAVVVLGRHNLDLGERRQRLRQRHDARRLVAVVVAEQDLHAGRL